MSTENAPQGEKKHAKRPPISIAFSLDRASKAVDPFRLVVSKGINPGGYAVDVIASATGAKRELANGMTARELVAFLNGIVMAATIVGKTK